ncbi:efflux transporter, RND family, MFP subunit [Desulfarculus baarsii DSM 2075]|uniref:Efflux transporter, RND family, MFP subunit n=1 Tax=Desulfarculus baarsii (strain ATCC 33931 / DSM 2075 / LMG 7858 / VKM B-1802 / 2st14) TaxID=644282 RepID=E1QJ03_DESB2|nr:efflux RND transporter periplasmic adaptor subunit [Desulfarculus baarsii]ADK85546.1 efflux transporter, RND family, MFP subunit [Desulfarculus baarsii DSM 2075]
MKIKSKRGLHVTIAAGCLILGVLGMIGLIAAQKPLAEKPPEVVAPLVLVQKANTGPHRAVVEGQGTVAALRKSTLAAEIIGTVERVSPNLLPGGMFKRGEVLAAIEPEDYRLDVILRQNEVEQAQKNLQLAHEEASVAREEWKRLGLAKGDQQEPPPLVAKTPHLEAAQAALDAAQANLRKARLNLERTAIRAPFDGRVVTKNVDVGQYLAKGNPVATIFSTEAAEITVNLDDAELAWIDVPGLTTKGGQGSPARITTDFGGRRMEWQGRVVRAEGELDPRTRMVPVVVRVEKPYAHTPPLAVGMFVNVEILGRMMENVTVTPRGAVREGGVLWLVDDQGRLRFHKARVARYFADKAVLSPGLPQGAAMVTSKLGVVSDGMIVRVAAQGPKAAPTAPAAEKAHE